MSLRRIAPLSLVIVAASAGVALADQHAVGTYRGHTEGKFFSKASQGEGRYRRAKISFFVGETRISHTRIEIRVACADGSHTSQIIKHGGTIDIHSDGTFRATADNGSGTDVLKGRVRGTHASGRVRRDIHSHGQACSSGSIEWKARLSGD